MKDLPPRITGPTLVVMAALLWGTTGTSQALAPAGANPVAVGTMRIAIGGICLLLLALRNQGFRNPSPWNRRYTLIAVLSTAAYQLTFFGGTKLTGVAVGTIVGIGSVPILGGLLAVMFEGEVVGKAWVRATGVTLVGVILLLLSGDSNAEINVWGILLAIGAGLSYAIFTLMNKRLLRQHRPDEVMAVSFCLGALVLLPALLFVDTAWIGTSSGIVIVLHLGLIATGLSYALFGRGLQHTPVAATSTLTLAEPLTAGILGILVLREPTNCLSLMGIILIVLGLGILAITQGHHRKHS